MTSTVLATDVSLLSGWAPTALQAIGIVLLIPAVTRRSRRWLTVWLPVSVVVGVLVALVVRWYVEHHGTGEPLPLTMWLWVSAAGLAAAVAVLGWRGVRWWQRLVSVLAVPMALLCAALILNQWLAYLPTVNDAWARATGAPLSGQTDRRGVAEKQREGEAPAQGTMVEVAIPDTASGFRHRKELLYLPPAWYGTNPPPKLPVVVIVDAQFGHPTDWVVAGGAQKTLDEFAGKHGGNAPVVVFVDSSGTFNNDTECVNGARGNAADHITDDVVPYIISEFGVSPGPANWGITGWSAGGACSVLLTVKYPQLFSAFVDIDGQKGPFAGDKQQTTARLFDGDAAAWADFDPRTIMGRHGRYSGVAGLFVVSEESPTMYRDGAPQQGASLPPEPSEEVNVLDAAATLKYMCELSSFYGIECAVTANPGTHDFRNAGQAFAESLPWLAGRLGTPQVPPVKMPGQP
ncbi:MAG: hypothetical protein QOD36_1149 [Mycobacterium sp.]|nr:hypothetical protein [Mycobacterium sp.]